MMDEQSMAIVPAQTTLAPAKSERGSLSLKESRDYAQVFVASGLFKDTKSLAQAQVKIMMGQELGLGPFASMNMIEIVEGKAELKPSGMRALILRDGKYDYKVTKLDETVCVVEFYRLREPYNYTGPSTLLGASSFSQADATRAGLGGSNAAFNMYKKYPRNMLISRATSNGVKWFCPDVFMGDVYYQGELREEREGAVDAEAIEERSDEVAKRYEDAALYMSDENKNTFTAMYYDQDASDEQLIAFCVAFMPKQGDNP